MLLGTLFLVVKLFWNTKVDLLTKQRLLVVPVTHTNFLKLWASDHCQQVFLPGISYRLPERSGVTHGPFQGVVCGSGWQTSWLFGCLWQDFLSLVPVSIGIEFCKESWHKWDPHEYSQIHFEIDVCKYLKGFPWEWYHRCVEDVHFLRWWEALPRFWRAASPILETDRTFVLHCGLYFLWVMACPKHCCRVPQKHFTSLGCVTFPTFTMIDFNKAAKPREHSTKTLFLSEFHFCAGYVHVQMMLCTICRLHLHVHWYESPVLWHIACLGPRIEKGTFDGISVTFAVVNLQEDHSPKKSWHYTCASPVAFSSSDFRSLFICSCISGEIINRCPVFATVFTRADEVHFSLKNSVNLFFFPFRIGLRAPSFSTGDLLVLRGPRRACISFNLCIHILGDTLILKGHLHNICWRYNIVVSALPARVFLRDGQVKPTNWPSSLTLISQNSFPCTSVSICVLSCKVMNL